VSTKVGGVNLSR